MFTPNQTGQIQHVTGYDLFGQQALEPPRSIRFAVVNLRLLSGKTTVRADSSASRGTTDEITTDLARILVAKHERIEIGDVFLYDGQSFDVRSKHVRRSVFGNVDHYECELEARPR